MENEINQKNIKDKVLEKIQMDNLSMRPRFYFTLKIAALALVALLALIVTVLLFNFIIFSIFSSGRTFLLAFGPRGYVSFLQFFPWTLLVLDIVLIILLQWMLRWFRFGYRSPALYLVLGLLVVALSIGTLLDQATGFNTELESQAKSGHLPSIFGDFIMHSKRPPEPGNGICRCTVLSISGSVVVVADIDFASTSIFTITLPKNSREATTSGLNVGDEVFIVGDSNADGGIQAFGLRIIEQDDRAHVEPSRAMHY